MQSVEDGLDQLQWLALMAVAASCSRSSALAQHFAFQGKGCWRRPGAGDDVSAASAGANHTQVERTA